MCRSMADIRSTAAEIREEKKRKIEEEEDRKKLQGKNIMPPPLLHRAAITRISCRWLTRATRCITANVQVDAQCDKLATELSWQRFVLKVANFLLFHMHLTYTGCIWHLRWEWPCLSFAEIFGTRKLESLGYRVNSCGVVCAILCVAVSIEHRLAKNGRTDGETDTRPQLITARVKTAQECIYVLTGDSCTPLLDVAPYKFHTELEAVSISWTLHWSYDWPSNSFMDSYDRLAMAYLASLYLTNQL